MAGGGDGLVGTGGGAEYEGGGGAVEEAAAVVLLSMGGRLIGGRRGGRQADRETGREGGRGEGEYAFLKSFYCCGAGERVGTEYVVLLRQR